MGKVLTDRDISVSYNYVIPNFSSYAPSRCVVQGEISPQSSSNTASTYYRFIKSTDNYKVATYSEFQVAPQGNKIKLEIEINFAGEWVLTDASYGAMVDYFDGNYIVPGEWNYRPIDYYYDYDGMVLQLLANNNGIYDSAGALEFSFVGGNETFGLFHSDLNRNQLMCTSDGYSYPFLQSESVTIASFRTNYSTSDHNIDINIIARLNNDYTDESYVNYKTVDQNGNMIFMSSFDTKLKITYNKTSEELTVVLCDAFDDSYYGPSKYVFNTRNGLDIIDTSEGKRVVGTIELPVMFSLFAT